MSVGMPAGRRGTGSRAVEVWELMARESIRDLVARYNANGDAGRFGQVLELFAPDASMELVDGAGTVQRYQGHDAIATIFTGTKDRWDAAAGTAPGRTHHVRHFVATHRID